MTDMSNNDGGAAFPVPEVMGEGREGPTAYMVSAQGMSLRDYFAAKAMALADKDQVPAEVAADAYAIADAMLAERAKS
jgi:hypothetical protein